MLKELPKAPQMLEVDCLVPELIVYCGTYCLSLLFPSGTQSLLNCYCPSLKLKSLLSGFGMRTACLWL